jgi:hypothetical protein
VGDSSLSVEFLEIGLDCGWMLVWVHAVAVGSGDIPPFSTSSSLSVSSLHFKEWMYVICG